MHGEHMRRILGSVSNVKAKLLLLFSVMGILLVISAPVVTSVFVDLTSPSVTVSMSSTAAVFVDPVNILNESLQSGSTFTVQVNVSDVNDLFAWQVNMSWNSSILNVSSIISGEFLARADNQTSSEALGGVVINSTDNVQGYGLFAESILGDVAGISGNGTLVSVEFLVLEYGWTDLNISVSGTLPTTLLDSAGSSVTFTTVGGYFSNKIVGDVDGDGDVDRYDYGYLAQAYGTSIGDLNFNPSADIWGDPSDPDPSIPDGDVDRYDYGILALNYGQSI